MELKSKELFKNTLDSLIKIGEDCSLNTQEAETLNVAVNEMPLLVPVVGEFSAGKSSLLNNCIGKKILSVAMTPETALPAELYYSENEYDEGVRADGSTERINNLTDAAKKYVCVRRYINSDFLKNIQPLVLVDMPGFDSPLDAHNKAIFNYLDKGSHYVVITPVDAGTVSSSMAKQIENILAFGKDCTFFVSKTDLRSEEETAQVVEEIASELEPIVGYRPQIAKLSQNDVSLFNTFAASLNPDELFKKQFLESVKDECYSTKASLNTKIAALRNDKEKNRRAVEELKESLEKINAKKEKMIDAAKSNGYTSEADSVANAVGSALNAELDTLADIAANSGKEALSEEINSIVQNTVVSKIQTVISGVSARFGQELSGEIKNLSDILVEYNATEVMQKLQGTAESLFDSAKSAIGNWSKDRVMMTDGEGQGSGKGGAYKAITGILAAATEIFSPVVEIIIIMLPEILNFIFGKVQESNNREKIKESISSQIPSIKRQVREKVVQVLKENSESMISAISEKFDAELSKKQAEIEEAMQRSENESSITERIALYEENIAKSEKLLEAIL